MIYDKNEFQFTGMDGWLTRWKNQHEIVSKKLHVKNQDIDSKSAKDWTETIWKTILEPYAPQNICNRDETELYYRATHHGFQQICNFAGKTIKPELQLLFFATQVQINLIPLEIGKSTKHFKF